MNLKTLSSHSQLKEPKISQAYLASFFTPDLNSNLCMEAVGLGGRGGLDGKYVKNNRKQNTDHPNSEI